MNSAVRDQYEQFPYPSEAEAPVISRPFDPIDDSLHFGWGWARHRFVYRRWDGLRILDAGCGSGLTSVGLAKLNPGSTVLGLDVAEKPLILARHRAEASGIHGLEFRHHDLDEPIPSAWGTFDFVVCRRVLGQVDDPVKVLKHLGATLDPRGLLLATFPASVGRGPAVALRLAVEALAGPNSTLGDQATLGLELLTALRPDHPIRQYDAARHGGLFPRVDQFVATYLNVAERGRSVAEAIRLLEAADLQVLVVPAKQPWRPEEILSGPVGPALRREVTAIDDRRMAALTDALNPTLHGEEYRFYACSVDFEPRLPTWPESLKTTPEVVEPLIPHPTGLAAPSRLSDRPGWMVYRTVTGAFGEVDERSSTVLKLVNDHHSCGAIDQLVSEKLGTVDSPEKSRDRWVELANLGFIALESLDRREHVDCTHLGPVLDRLDCACPRRWVRACELHGHCTITRVGPDDEKAQAIAAALNRLTLHKIIACDDCPDYTADE